VNYRNNDGWKPVVLVVSDSQAPTYENENPGAPLAELAAIKRMALVERITALILASCASLDQG